MDLKEKNVLNVRRNKMGRAIDMENDIHKLKERVNRIDAAVSKIINVVEELQSKSVKVTTKNDTKSKQRTSKAKKEPAKESV
tara:strand:- start:503 stop:748 length:246 start_codon:yes stop_codon:yes gene_type:complete